MAQVQVDRRVLWFLGLGCGCALLGLAFTLGRLSSPAPPPTAPEPAQPEAAPPSPRAAFQPPVGAFDHSGETQPVPRIADLPAVPQPVEPAPDAGSQRAVAAYFEAVDALQPSGFGGEPQALAQEIATGLGKGDSSGMDRVIQQTEAVRQKLSNLRPPAPCGAHHKACLASLDDSLSLLRSLKQGATAGDGSLLTQLATSAQAMQSRAQALQKEDEALRRRFGLR